jgi:hypothetical protein
VCIISHTTYYTPSTIVIERERESETNKKYDMILGTTNKGGLMEWFFYEKY